MSGLRLTDIFSIVRRRAWLVMVCVCLIAPIGVAVAYILPPKYRSTANVLVEEQQIPSQLADTVITTSAFERLNRIQQRLLAREQLLTLIDELELFGDRPEMSPGEKVAHMRRNITIEEVFGGTQRNPKLVGIKVSFTDQGPGRAARVANALVDVILTWNIEDRQETATETRAFFQDQVARLTDEIDATERDIIAYQSENACCLPATLAQRQTQLANLEGQTTQREQNLFTLREQIRGIEQQLRDGVFQSQTRKTPAEQQLDQLQIELTQALAIFSENSTRVRALRAQIEQLEASVGAPDETGEVVSPAELQARAQIDALGRQIALIEQQETEAAAQKAALQESIRRTATVELELNRLERVLAGLQTQFNEATRDLNVARQGQELEVNRQGERFELVEPAQVPSAADSPNRPVIAAGGVFVGVFFGAALVALLEIFDRSIRTSYAMEHRVGLRPVVSIPYVRTARERVFARVRWAAFFLFMLIVVPAVLYAIDVYVMPLELVIERVADRTGIDRAVALIQERLNR